MLVIFRKVRVLLELKLNFVFLSTPGVQEVGPFLHPYLCVRVFDMLLMML